MKINLILLCVIILLFSYSTSPFVDVVADVQPTVVCLFSEEGSGTGFIISKDGYIITNNHVIQGMETITVILLNGNSFKGMVVKTDAELDIALIKIIRQKDLPYVTFGNSDKINVGERVIAIGNPFGIGHTVTTGIISAMDRLIIPLFSAEHGFIQTDANINPGNSGGPLFNIKGEVIGMNTLMISPVKRVSVGLGFAIPINRIKEFLGRMR